MATSPGKSHLARARILLQTSRYADAERELRRALVDDPDNDGAHALLALALFHQKRLGRALHEARVAVGLAPNDDFNHYIHAIVLLGYDREDQALIAIREALRLDPTNAAYYDFAGSFYLRRKQWRRALELAEQGLQQEPDHVGCTNLRGRALVQLGEGAEAQAAMEEALAQDPENARTHANMGWAKLNAGDAEGAFAHFREALRINPLSGWARAGIVEAMKARNILYRGLLRYTLWMSRLTDEEQWEVVGAIILVRSGLRAAARAFFPLYLIVLPLNLLYFCFRMLTWIGRPLFALVLRFDRFGRQALPKEEIVASNWLALCLLTALLSVILGLALWQPAFLVLLLVALGMVVPVAGVFRAPRGWGRITLALYSALMALSGLGAFALALVGKPWALAAMAALGAIFFLGWTFFFWVALVVLIFSR
jgi:tetratricopeptide (TPR) repeat protein